MQLAAKVLAGALKLDLVEERVLLASELDQEYYMLDLPAPHAWTLRNNGLGDMDAHCVLAAVDLDEGQLNKRSTCDNN